MAQNCPNAGFTSGHNENVECGICFRLHCPYGLSSQARTLGMQTAGREKKRK